MVRKLSTTVLALAIAAASLTAATIDERGEHLAAIKALADRGLRLSAARDAAAFAKARSPDDGGAKQVLEFYLAQAFAATAPAPKNQEYAETVARLQPAIDKMAPDKLPADLKNLLGGGGAVLRL